MSKHTLGTYVASQREEKGWTQRELAKRAKCSHTTINKIENDLIAQPSIDLILAIAKALKLPVQCLILAYQRKNPNLASSLDKESLKYALSTAINHIIDEQFSSP